MRSLILYIDLSGISDFEGLFRINDTEVTSFADAPLIRNVHVKDGEVAFRGGFIVQKEQKLFIVDSCSSAGNVTGSRAGGISGYKSGNAKILNSYSTGNILGNEAGGITGRQFGSNGDIANITQCYSTGTIEGPHAGGICGNGAGLTDGQVYIKQSYSTGDILSDAQRSGGIVGNAAGFNGYVFIQECYSTGNIYADKSGGISGAGAANNEGEVHILDCYTRGHLDGKYAGGITGMNTGGSWNHPSGNVYINNTYTSGIGKHRYAGGIVGKVSGQVHVQYSVYNDHYYYYFYDGKGKIAGDTDPADKLEEMGNSNKLDDIRGQLYHYEGIQRWASDTWAINGTDSLPILRFQLPSSSSKATQSKFPHPLTARPRILPVQRPPRSVRNHSSQRKRRRNQTN